MGASRPWPEVLKLINGGSPSNLMDTDAIIEYFQPLEQWLTVQNGREGLEGWDISGLDTGRRRFGPFMGDPRHF